MTMTKSTFPLAITLHLLLLAGCTPGVTPTSHADAAADSGGATGSSVTSPLATACNANGDCTSGFCVDNVCCDSACDQECLSCALPGALGHCGPIPDGPDPSASTPCTGSQSCFLDHATSLSTCKAVDGAECSSDVDCGSGHCVTYYVDADGDGFGTASSKTFCNELNAAPPAGYAAYSGDCCDIDNRANPGFPSGTYLEFPDACGSFDWNCNGVVAQGYTTSCAPSGPPACGAACVVNLGIVVFTAYTQACN
jgi:hypothetical protein